MEYCKDRVLFHSVTSIIVLETQQGDGSACVNFAWCYNIVANTSKSLLDINKNMLEKPFKVFFILIILLVGIGFVTASFNSDRSKTARDETAEDESREKIVLQHKYFASANSYSGSIMTPTACYSWYTDIELDNTDPEEITLILNTSDDGTEDCEEKPARKDFTFIVPSSPEARLVSVELNGQSIDFEILGNSYFHKRVF